jgi:TonB family protein
MAVPRFRFAERHVLMLVLTVSFIGFAAAFFLGNLRGHAKPMAPTEQARIHWVPPQVAGSNAPQSVIADYFDPSLMSLPNAHGFSSLMWGRSAEMAPRVFVPPTELALLDPTTDREMAVLLPETSLTNKTRSVVERLPATAGESFTGETTEVTTVATQSTLHVEGVLEQRDLQSRPDLPAVKVDTDLRPTRVRLAVAPDGRVRYATLDRSCGSDAVDAQALDVAGQLRFEPASAADPLALTWGVVKFYWATHN